jgi:uncharacterized protein (TIGR02646 family)
VKAITKSTEPASLTLHRATPHSNYENYAQKAELREALVHEQQGLCCYCMARVASNSADTKIEHWRSRSRYPEAGLVYRNLLGACGGGHGQPRHLQHCDTLKGDRDLKWNPAEPDHPIEQSIRFESDGSIASSDAEFNRQLNEVLGLNVPHLRNSRKGVLTAVLQWWKSETGRLRGPVPRDRLVRERSRHAGKGTTTLLPFSPVAMWWLDQRLNRAKP